MVSDFTTSFASVKVKEKAIRNLAIKTVKQKTHSIFSLIFMLMLP